MQKLLLLILAFVTGFAAQAQNTTEDVVYLKNGSIIRGKILSVAPDGPLKIELLGGSLFVFQQGDIDSVKQESILKNKLARIKKDYFRRDRGFRHISEVGLVYGINLKPDENDPYNYYGTNGDDLGISVHTVNGYQWWPYLFTGGGVGIDRYINYKQTFSPFYVRIATEFLKKKVTPYAFIDAGYALMWKQRNTEAITYHNKGGVYVSAGGGLRIYTRSRASVMLSASYKQTRSETRWEYNYYEGAQYYTIKRIYHRMALNIGVTF